MDVLDVDAVKQIRETLGLSSQQVSDFLGLTPADLDACERGEQAFTVDQMERLIDLFGDDPQASLLTNLTMNPADLQPEDLEAIANIQRIARNLDEMHGLLQEPAV